MARVGRILRITALASSFRRAGLAFGPQPVEVDPDDLSAPQLFALTHEPKLRVEGSLDGEEFVVVPPMDEETLAALADRDSARKAADDAAGQESSETAEDVDQRVGESSGGAASSADIAPVGGDAGGAGPEPSAADVSEAIDPNAPPELREAAGETSTSAEPAPPTGGSGRRRGGAQSPRS